MFIGLLCFFLLKFRAVKKRVCPNFIRFQGILSNNVNQIAKRMNEHGSIYETEIDEILEKQEEITQLIRQIYERLEVLYE